MTAAVSLEQAIDQYVVDGCTLAMEGFTHLIPFAAGHEVIRQQKRDLTLIRMTPDIIYDQLIGVGAAKHVVFSWGGNPGVGSLWRFRDAIENQYPNRITYEEYSHAALANAYDAGAANVPFAVMRGFYGSDLPSVNGNIKSVACPFTGETLAAVPALRPDVTIVHAQKANPKGDVLFEGIIGVQKTAALAAKSVIVTVEEVVDDFSDCGANACILPHWVVDAIAIAPHGAHPSYAHGYYDRDNDFYRAWDAISRDRSAFQRWIDRNVLSIEGSDNDQPKYLGEAAVV